MALPKIISVDDHVVEPPELWTSRLPKSLHDRVPHVRSELGGFAAGKYDPNKLDWAADPGVPNAGWADVWYYDDMVVPLTRGLADCGYTTEDPSRPVTYDEVLPGCFQRDARLADMAADHTDVSLCFPTVPRFCGRIFMERQDKKVGLECVRAFNDWMIEGWCGDTSRAERLIPLTLIPLWDPALAADEVRRCAAKGSHAIAFLRPGGAAQSRQDRLRSAAVRDRLPAHRLDLARLAEGGRGTLQRGRADGARAVPVPARQRDQGLQARPVLRHHRLIRRQRALLARPCASAHWTMISPVFHGNPAQSL
jgi:Amidohydrolase